MHCSNLAADALHEAITNFRRGRGEIVDEEDKPADDGPECVVGQEEYLGKGVFEGIGDKTEFKDQRTLILHTGDESVEAAIDLTDQTDRVVLLTPEKTVMTTPELEKRLEDSSVKLLTESRLLEIRGEFEVEKVLIFNIEEDEEYELFVDAVVIIE
jgi:nitrogen fixation NifU-like protein